MVVFWVSRGWHPTLCYGWKLYPIVGIPMKKARIQWKASEGFFRGSSGIPRSASRARSQVFWRNSLDDFDDWVMTVHMIRVLENWSRETYGWKFHFFVDVFSMWVDWIKNWSLFMVLFRIKPVGHGDVWLVGWATYLCCLGRAWDRSLPW